MSEHLAINSLSKLECNRGSKNCAEFQVIYYKSGVRMVYSYFLDKDTGYELVRKLAARLPVGFMASPVHYLDVVR